MLCTRELENENEAKTVLFYSFKYIHVRRKEMFDSECKDESVIDTDIAIFPLKAGYSINILDYSVNIMYSERQYQGFESLQW